MRFMGGNPLFVMKTNLPRMAALAALGVALTLTSCVDPYYAGGYPRAGVSVGYQSGRPLVAARSGYYSRPGSYYGRNTGYYRSPYYGVRSTPVYVQRSSYPYRYGSFGYSPYRDVYSPYGYGGWGAPYRSGMVVSSFGRPAFGYGSGWGYNPYGW